MEVSKKSYKYTLIIIVEAPNAMFVLKLLDIVTSEERVIGSSFASSNPSKVPEWSLTSDLKQTNGSALVSWRDADRTERRSFQKMHVRPHLAFL
jgi:hypothetical protein